jgi:WD40 repeat protein
VGYRDRTIVIWDVERSQVMYRLVGHTQPISSIAFSRDGQTIVSGTGNTALFSSGEVKLWSVASGQAHATLPSYGGPVVVDPSDHVLAVTDHSGRSIAIWSVASDRADAR